MNVTKSLMENFISRAVFSLRIYLVNMNKLELQNINFSFLHAVLCINVRLFFTAQKIKSSFMNISKSSSAAGRTGRRPVLARVILAFRLNLKVIIISKSSLTGRSPVRPAADDDFKAYGNLK